MTTLRPYVFLVETIAARYFPMKGLGHAWPGLTDEALAELDLFLASGVSDDPGSGAKNRGHH